jgi:uncharacterized protein (TIGR02453 family)
MAVATPAFAGFRPEAIQFLADLAENNDRAWFQPRKAEYERLLKEPLEALIAALAERFEARGIPLRADPAKSPFRIYRDVRFSKDKSPYKTNAAAVASEGGGTTLYLSLSAEGLHVGGGAYHLARDQLTRFRAAVGDDGSGAELEAIAAGLRDMRADVTGRTQLKTAPRGYRTDHPRIDLLRQDGLIGIWAHPPRAWLYTAKAADRVAESWRALRPLNRWLQAHVGSTTLPGR